MVGYFRTWQDAAFPPFTLHSPLRSLNLVPLLKNAPLSCTYLLLCWCLDWEVNVDFSFELFKTHTRVRSYEAPAPGNTGLRSTRSTLCLSLKGDSGSGALMVVRMLCCPLRSTSAANPCVMQLWRAFLTHKAVLGWNRCGQKWLQDIAQESHHRHQQLLPEEHQLPKKEQALAVLHRGVPQSQCVTASNWILCIKDLLRSRRHWWKAEFPWIKRRKLLFWPDGILP